MKINIAKNMSVLYLWKSNSFWRSIFLPIIIGLFCTISIHPELKLGRLDNIENSLNLLNNTESDPYEWIICGTTSWQDLKNYLPEAKIASISVVVKLLPPYQVTQVCPNSSYSEPYQKDYIRWAQEIAKLSLRYSNLIGFEIGDLRENLNLGYLTQGYLNQILTASKAINPKLQFVIPYNIWYVDKDAKGNRSGSSWINASTTVSGLPWASITGGDTVYISGGSISKTYSMDSLYYKNITYGIVTITKGHDLGHNGEVIYSNQNINIGKSFVMYSCNNIKLTNLTFKWLLDKNANNVNFYIKACQDIYVDNCHFVSNGRAWVLDLNTSFNIHLTNNLVETFENPYDNGQDTYMARCSQIIITGNTFISRGTAGDVNASHKDHIQMEEMGYGYTNNNETVIANNFFYYPAGNTTSQSILTEESYTQRYLIYNNVISDHTEGMNGIWISPVNDAVSVSARIFNNTIVSTGSTGIGMSFGYNGYRIDTLIMKNNIVYADLFPIHANTYNTTIATAYADIDSNRYYKVGGGSFMEIWQSGYGSMYLSFTQWQALGHDVHSTNSMISFADESGSSILDYITTVGRDVGADLSTYFTIDILGNKRPYNSLWDMGAIEYHP